MQKGRYDVIKRWNRMPAEMDQMLVQIEKEKEVKDVSKG